MVVDDRGKEEPLRLCIPGSLFLAQSALIAVQLWMAFHVQ